MVFLERKRRAQGIFFDQIEDIFAQQFLFRRGTKIKPWASWTTSDGQNLCGVTKQINIFKLGFVTVIAVWLCQM